MGFCRPLVPPSRGDAAGRWAARRRLGACVSGGRARLGSALRRRDAVGLGRLPPPALGSPALCVRGAMARGLAAHFRAH